jgi:hypothetical protein
MVREIKIICKACEICEKGKVRRQNLSAEFEQADKDDIPLPRQAYGIDFYGHTKSEILVAIDLCAREVSLWFLTDRKTEDVTRALLSGLMVTQIRYYHGSTVVPVVVPVFWSFLSVGW